MTVDFAAARDNMLESQVRTADVTDHALQDAIRVVPRETLVAPGKTHAAYADAEVEYGPGLYLLRPRDIAKLLQALAPKAGEQALAIGAPYAAAVLEAMGLAVTRQDGEAISAAPASQYDLIITEGAVAEVPAAWLSALKVGGRLGVVVRGGPIGRAMTYIHAQDGVGGRPMFDSGAPFLPGFEPKAAFAF